MRQGPLQHFPAAPLLHLRRAIAIADRRAVAPIGKRLNYRAFVPLERRTVRKATRLHAARKNFCAGAAKWRNRSRARHYRVNVLSQV
jgi:hypothetical protein